MVTTIQIQEDTLDFLKHLRKQLDVPSYDMLIKELIQKAMTPKQSFWGKAGKMGMKEILKNLRDKDDRY